MTSSTASSDKPPAMLYSVSEFEFGPAFDAVDIGIIVLDRRECIVGWNEWMARVARQPKPAVLGKSLYEVFPSLRDTRLPAVIGDSFQVGFEKIGEFKRRTVVRRDSVLCQQRDQSRFQRRCRTRPALRRSGRQSASACKSADWHWIRGRSARRKTCSETTCSEKHSPNSPSRRGMPWSSAAWCRPRQRQNWQARRPSPKRPIRLRHWSRLPLQRSPPLKRSSCRWLR